MKQPTSARKCRGSNIKLQKRLTSRRRKLLFESFEERAMLAADCGISIPAEGEGIAPLVAIELKALDLETFQPLEAIHQGEEFILAATVEDLRPIPAGVFGAYLDLLYPSDVFNTTGDGGEAVLIFGKRFGNGKSGVATPGMVDELGNFAAGATRTGGGEQVLAGLRLVATRTGEVQFTSNAAEVTPDHDTLLFDNDAPVPSSLVAYGSLSINVLEPRPEEIVDAITDVTSVNENSADNLLAVLENDRNTTSGQLTIAEVDTTGATGSVTIVNEGTVLLYTPEAGFVGTDEFTYTATADGKTDTTTVRVDVKRVIANEDQVAFDFEITDQNGIPISSVAVGEEFLVHVTAEDLRTFPTGVFASYMDVRYTTDTARPSGAISYGAAYPNGHQGSTTTVGLIDEVGAFAGTNPIGAGQFEVFQIPFTASAPGRVVFEANPAEEVPNSDTLLYGVDQVVAFDDILFGRATINVTAGVVAVDDSFNVQVSSTAHLFSVLDNDLSLDNGPLHVESVDSTGVLGTVAVTPDGLGVTYLPPSGFGGSEQFNYTITGPAGSSSAEVTVHVDPFAEFGDQVEIRLETTDLAGNLIESIPAGQEFLVTAFLKDLRPEGVDRGVYAAYLDLLFDADLAHPVIAPDQPAGVAIAFGPDYQNGRRGDASVPGVIDELGAFQTSSIALGSDEIRLLSARFQATAADGVADSFQILEDQATALSVLSNDIPKSGSVTFQVDPADEVPNSDVLLYDPVEPVGFNRVRHGQATLAIAAGGQSGIVSVSAGSAGGTISVSDNGESLSYSPAPNFNGIERFTYSLGGSSSVEVAVTVAPVNDAPSANSDSYRVRAGKAVTVSERTGVIANDVDVDRDLLTATLVSDVSNGTLQFEVDGSFTYQPADTFVGSDSFTYKISDGTVDSGEATVTINVVPRPVSVHLEAIDANGVAVSAVIADAPLVVRATVQDLRASLDADLGIGAAYLDIAYDVADVEPIPSPNMPLGLEARFGSAYQNGLSGEVLPQGRVNDIGAFQSEFAALGGDAHELFTLAFDLGGPRTANESYIVAQAAELDILANEAEVSWQVTLDAQHAANSPNADLVYLDPAEVVPQDDIQYDDVVVAVRNGDLSIQSVGDAQSGASISVDDQGRVFYQAVEGFSGTDSFTYVVVDSQGRTGTATATIEVTQAWQNPVTPTDVNADGHDSPADALIIINELNAVGSHRLSAGIVSTFLDVNGDGSVSAVDVLIVINRIIAGANSAEGEALPEFPQEESERFVDLVSAPEVLVPAPEFIVQLLPARKLNATLIVNELSESSSIDSPAVPSLSSAPAAATVRRDDEVLTQNFRDDELAELLDAIAADVSSFADSEF